MRTTILRPPRLRTAETEAERSASWLELFFDLVFVVAVANLGARLHGNLTWGGVFAFVGLFVPLWWAWVSFTFYVDRYDTDDLGQRILAVAQMVAIALIAAAISGDKADSMTAFALAYVLARVVLIAMYVRATKHVSGTADLTRGYIKGFSLGAAIWVISAFVPTPARFYLWAIGLAVEIYTPYYYRKIQAKVPLDASHLPERLGLFTILVLGESVAAVVLGLEHESWTVQPTIAGVLGVIVASSLWWLYFDNLDGSVVRRKPEQTKAWKPTAWIYAHFPLAVSLTATGIGLEFLVGETGHVLPDAERWLVFGGVATSLLAMALIHVATENPNTVEQNLARAQLRISGAAVALLFGFITNGAETLVVAFFVAALVMGLVALDVRIGVKVATPIVKPDQHATTAEIGVPQPQPQDAEDSA